MAWQTCVVRSVVGGQLQGPLVIDSRRFGLHARDISPLHASKRIARSGGMHAHTRITRARLGQDPTTGLTVRRGRQSHGAAVVPIPRGELWQADALLRPTAGEYCGGLLRRSARSRPCPALPSASVAACSPRPRRVLPASSPRPPRVIPAWSACRARPRSAASLTSMGQGLAQRWCTGMGCSRRGVQARAGEDRSHSPRRADTPSFSVDEVYTRFAKKYAPHASLCVCAPGGACVRLCLSSRGLTGVGAP